MTTRLLDEIDNFIGSISVAKLLDTNRVVDFCLDLRTIVTEEESSAEAL